VERRYLVESFLSGSGQAVKGERGQQERIAPHDAQWRHVLRNGASLFQSINTQERYQHHITRAPLVARQETRYGEDTLFLNMNKAMPAVMSSTHIHLRVL
jgi:hypothetical protein